MTALEDRRLWLAHLHECTRCPTDLCDRGWELAEAVRASLAPGESWEGVWAPKERGSGAVGSVRWIIEQEAPPSDEEEAINLAIFRGFGGPHDHPGLPWPDERPSYHDGV